MQMLRSLEALTLVTVMLIALLIYENDGDVMIKIQILTIQTYVNHSDQSNLGVANKKRYENDDI